MRRYDFILGRKYLVSTPAGNPVVYIYAYDRGDLKLLQELKELGNRIIATDLLAHVKAA